MVDRTKETKAPTNTFHFNHYHRLLALLWRTHAILRRVFTSSDETISHTNYSRDGQTVPLRSLAMLWRHLSVFQWEVYRDLHGNHALQKKKARQHGGVETISLREKDIDALVYSLLE